jgi:hypothetical protein
MLHIFNHPEDIRRQIPGAPMVAAWSHRSTF